MKSIFITLFLFTCSFLFSQIAPRPNPPRLYNNLSVQFPDFLNSAEAAQLEEKLQVFSNETSNQICVVIIDDLNDLDGADYAFKLGTEWGVGQKESNNGVVILVKPTKENGGRYLEIAIGYGLEGAIPDLATKRIREDMTVYLKNGANFEALDRGTNTLMGLAKGEIDKANYTRQSKRGSKRGVSIFVILLVIVILIISRFFGGGRGGRTYSGLGSALFWGSMMGGSGFGGRGGGGSSSGGGFGGFGGGSFGGGGSGGSW
jgi:uncharacterized protein